MFNKTGKLFSFNCNEPTSMLEALSSNKIINIQKSSEFDVLIITKIKQY